MIDRGKSNRFRISSIARARSSSSQTRLYSLFTAVVVGSALLLTPATEPGRRNLGRELANAVATPAAVLNPVPLFETVRNSPELAEALPAIGEAVSSPARVIKTVAVNRGDTLLKVLTSAGADRDESHQAIAALSKLYNPRRLQLGQEITLTFEKSEEQRLRLAALDLTDSVERAVNVVRADTGFTAQEIMREFEQGYVRAAGNIDDSLYNSALAAGVPLPILHEMIKLFSYDVDFQREVQPGDSFELFYERFFDDAGKPVKIGRIVAAAMTLSGQELRYYLHQPSDSDEPDYFNSRGQSVRKALLRTPIDGARLSSGFGMRSHPILGYSTMHKGIDFAAPAGTPIQAAGDGVVELAGDHGAYGNYVRLRHNNTFSTAYAHMSQIAVRSGQRVRQGQVLGYVGSTGRSTGPHLHYEVLTNNKQVNPLSLRLPTGRVLEGRELARFRAAIEDVAAKMASTPSESWYAAN